MNNQNLRPWKPGQSGNPKGRPKGTLLEKTIEKVLESEAMRESLTECLIAHAQQGNMMAMKLLMNAGASRAVASENDCVDGEGLELDPSARA